MLRCLLTSNELDLFRRVGVDAAHSRNAAAILQLALDVQTCGRAQLKLFGWRDGGRGA